MQDNAGVPRRWPALIAALAVSCAMLLGTAVAASASSGTVYVVPIPPNGTSGLPTPGAMVVGDKNLPATVRVVDSSTNADATVGLVTVTMSCSAFSSFGGCETADSGVLAPSATGTGAAGTACDGVTFDITPISSLGGFDFAPDTYQFSPSAAYTVPAGGACVIDYTINVNKLPTDTDPLTLGAQSWMEGFGSSDGTPPPMYASGPGDCTSTGCGSNDRYTVVAPALDPTSTSVSCSPSPVVAGKTTTCKATVSDTASTGQSAPTGTVSFTSSGPGSISGGGACTLAAAGANSATCSVTYTPSATPHAPTRADSITGSYGGDPGHSASSGSDTLTVDSMPTSKSQCLNGGWQPYGVFTNQGDCVSYVSTGGANAP